MKKEKLLELIEIGDQQHQKLREIVINAIEEEKLISTRLYEFEDRHPLLSSRIADKIASFGGSWQFIIAFILFLALWISVNVYLLSKSFDPYPKGIVNDVCITNPDLNKGYPVENIKAPTLIFHAIDDPMPPFETAKQIAARIPGAQFVQINSGAHLLVGHHKKVQNIIRGFIKEKITEQ